MESKIIPLDFGIYASVQLNCGRVSRVNKLIDGACNDMVFLPAELDSVREIKDSNNNDYFCPTHTSYRRIYDDFSMLNIVSKDLGVIRVLYHNASRKIVCISLGPNSIFSIYPDFILVKERQIIKKDGSILCDSRTNIHLAEGKDCYVACINCQWSIINKGTLSIMPMSDELPENDTEDRYDFATFVNDKIQIKDYNESFLCDTQGRILIKSHYGEYNYCETDNGPVWVLTNTEYGSDVYDAEDYSFRYTIERRPPSAVIDEEFRPYLSNGLYKVISSRNYCFGIVEYDLANNTIAEIIPPIYPQLKIAGDWEAFIVSPDIPDDREYKYKRPKFGIIDSKGRTRVPFKYSKIERNHVFYVVYGYNEMTHQTDDAFAGLLTLNYKPIQTSDFRNNRLIVINAEPYADHCCSRFIVLVKDGDTVKCRYYITRNGELKPYDASHISRNENQIIDEETETLDDPNRFDNSDLVEIGLRDALGLSVEDPVPDDFTPWLG